MRLFCCPSCAHILFFGNVRCERCETTLGYDPERNTMVSLEADTRWRYCANHAHDVCNWLLPADSDPAQGLCIACRHNLVIPDLTIPSNLVWWRRIEEAKHQLLYTILRLRLPRFDRATHPEGLAFEFRAPDAPTAQVMTGHASGVITLALDEADDAERERRRTALREPYRTLLGHFRHEVGHWYWDRLVRDGDAQTGFTDVFGDASQPYGEALERHYASGPPVDWQAEYVSAYAAAHPWEDFAETWAHYFHIVDTLETGGAWGIVLHPRLDHDHILTTTLNFDIYSRDIAMTTISDAWFAFSIALNSFNRSMGLQDAYPFVLSPRVIEKLEFIHRLVRGDVPRAAMR